MLLVGHRAAAGRLRVQGGGGAVPHVGARRLRRRADADHGVHGRDGEGGRVRRVPARMARGVSRRSTTPGTTALWWLAARHDDRRQRDRARAAQPEAPARVLEHRPRRLSARRRGRRRRSQGASAMLFYLFVYTLATFGAFAVIVALTRPGRGTVMRRRAVGPLGRASMARRCDDGVHARAARLSRSSAAWASSPSGTCCRRRCRPTIRRRCSPWCWCSTTVVSAGYYLYVIMVMFMRAPSAEAEPLPQSPAADARRPRGHGRALSWCSGVFPNWLHRVAEAAGSPRVEHAASTRRASVGPSRFSSRGGASPWRGGHSRRNLPTVRHPRHRRPRPHAGGGDAPSGGRTPSTPRERGFAAPSRSAGTIGRADRVCATRWSTDSRRAGVDVVDIGVVPTPLLYWSLHHEPVIGGIQITGSHNPPEYNGFKLSSDRSRCTATESRSCTS